MSTIFNFLNNFCASQKSAITATVKQVFPVLVSAHKANGVEINGPIQ